VRGQNRGREESGEDWAGGSGSLERERGWGKGGGVGGFGGGRGWEALGVGLGVGVGKGVCRQRESGVRGWKELVESNCRKQEIAQIGQHLESRMSLGWLPFKLRLKEENRLQILEQLRTKTLNKKSKPCFYTVTFGFN
jgi:hypothetical protein